MPRPNHSQSSLVSNLAMMEQQPMKDQMLEEFEQAALCLPNYSDYQVLPTNKSSVQFNPENELGCLLELNQKMMVFDDAESKMVKPMRPPRKVLEPGFYKLKTTCEFPPDREVFYDVLDFQDFRRVIEDEKIRNGRREINFVVRQYKKEKWENLTAYCTNCRNEATSANGVKKIVLVNSHKTGGKFILKFFDNKHNHTLADQTSGAKMKNKIRTIKQQFHHAPKSMTITAFVEYIENKYHISPKLIKHALYAYKKQTENFTQTVDLVAKCNARCWFKNSGRDQHFMSQEQIQFVEEQPEIFITVYNEMYERFLEVGDVCYFALLNFRLKETVETAESLRHWDIFTAAGLTLNYMIEPFSITYLEINYKTAQTLAQIMAKLFEIFGKVPRVLITPNDPLFNDAIAFLVQQGVFKGLHLYDPIWQMDKIGSELDRYQDLSLFKNIIFSRTQADYIRNVQRLMQVCEPTPKIRKQLNKILKSADKLCFGCIETNEHIGTIFDYSGNKLIFDAIKQYLFRFIYKAQETELPLTRLKYAHSESKRTSGPIRSKYNIDNSKLNFSRITYIRCAKALMVVMRKSIVSVNCSSNYDIKPYEQVVEIPEIRTIRKSIKSNILNAFGEQYGRLYHLAYFQRKQHSQHPNPLTIYDMYDKSANSLFTVAPYPHYCSDGSLDKIIWKCNCLYSFKCGVPCAHEILASMVSKSSLFQLFKQEYTVFQKYKKVGRPRSTRRNTQK